MVKKIRYNRYRFSGSVFTLIDSCRATKVAPARGVGSAAAGLAGRYSAACSTKELY